MKTELALLLHYERPIMYASEVAELLDVTERTLENQIYAKRCPIPMFKMGSKYVAHLADVASYIDHQRSEAVNDGYSGSATELLQHPRRAA